jgi:cellulose synthase/poly-beta-1,6-N-acetylglucosamine synthase-like glycosyltransferase
MTMEFALWIASAASLALALHPFIGYPLSLLWFKRKPDGGATREESSPLTFTICMCAYNEENIIEQKARNLLALKAREPGLEVLIYVDAASDSTAAKLKPFSKDFDVHVGTERRGKTHGMNLLASRARGSVLVFTDANVMLDMECIENLRRAFADAEIGCVCGNLIYTNGNASITASTGSLYWRLEEHIKLLEQRTGSVMGADGSLFAIRRELHRAPPDHIIDDMFVSFMVLIQGYRLIQSTDVRAYEQSASNSSEEFHRKSRIACQAFNVHRLIWPHLRKLDALTVYKYVSHKLLRWLSIYFLTASMMFGLGALFAGGYVGFASVLVLLGAVLAFLGLRGTVKPLTQIMDVITSLAGAGLGVWKSLRGESYQTWTPVASVRRAAE